MLIISFVRIDVNGFLNNFLIVKFHIFVYTKSITLYSFYIITHMHTHMHKVALSILKNFKKVDSLH